MVKVEIPDNSMVLVPVQFLSHLNKPKVNSFELRVNCFDLSVLQFQGVKSIEFGTPPNSTQLNFAQLSVTSPG